MPESRELRRRYGDKEVGLILKRAAELQRQGPAGPGGVGGLSLGELEEIGAEAGIDPVLIRRAAGEIDTGAATTEFSAFLGAPTTLELEYTLGGELREEDFGVLVEEIQHALGELGRVSRLGRSLGWTSTNDERPISVKVSPRGGQTKIQIEERVGALAGGLFGGILGGVGGGGFAVAMAIGVAALGMPVLTVIGGWLVAVGGSYALARGIFRSVGRKRTRTLRQLLDRIADYVADSAVETEKLGPDAGSRQIPTQGTN